MFEDAAGSGHADPDDGAASHAGEHQTASSHSVDECGSQESEDELEAGVAQIDVGLLNVLTVAGSVQHGADEVGQDGVSCPSRKKFVLARFSQAWKKT